MNNTKFEVLYKIFLFKVQDYKQRNLFLKNENVATELCQSYLLKAIAKFTNCKKDIMHPNLELGEFNVELDILEQDIITNLMVEAWLDRLIMDITQMNLNLNDNDFKHYSEEKNLAGKSELRDRTREINSQQIWDYDFRTTNWTEWANGNFGI